MKNIAKISIFCKSTKFFNIKLFSLNFYKTNHYIP